jgi:hypothetical protein
VNGASSEEFIVEKLAAPSPFFTRRRRSHLDVFCGSCTTGIAKDYAHNGEGSALTVDPFECATIKNSLPAKNTASDLAAIPNILVEEGLSPADANSLWSQKLQLQRVYQSTVWTDSKCSISIPRRYQFNLLRGRTHDTATGSAGEGCNRH